MIKIKRVNWYFHFSYAGREYEGVRKSRLKCTINPNMFGPGPNTRIFHTICS